jgi:Sensors of blue-light using FAD
MKQLIYASKSSLGTDMSTVMQILTLSIERNKEHGVTGMLLFNNAYFLQCIEGEPAKIDQLVLNISKDVRHSDIFFIGEEEIEERSFKQWAMGYVNKTREIEDIFEGITGQKAFDPYKLNFKESRMLLRKLSHLI